MRQVAEAGQKVNPFEIGRGPFPLPFGQKTADVLKNFDVSTRPPQAGDLAIKLVFLFFSPNRPDMLPLHLQLLRGVASLFDSTLVARIAAAPGPAAALEIIRKAEAP